MLRVRLEKYRVLFGDSFAVSFERTLRVPDDGRAYPLPPGLGSVELLPAGPYRGRVPGEWADDDVLLSLYQREAVWVAFHATADAPHAAQVGVGRVNAVSGGPWDEPLRADPQNYIVSPPQPWLDGINAGGASVRQFVAMPLGLGFTVERQLTGEEVVGGIQLRAYPLKPGRLPAARERRGAAAPESARARMGIAAGGVVEQRIYPDPHGVDAWAAAARAAVSIRIINSAQHAEITGRPPPPPPVSAQTYAEHGLPWFKLYDEHYGDVPAPDSLARVRSVRAIDEERGSRTGEAEGAIRIEPGRVTAIRHESGRDPAGKESDESKLRSDD